MELPIYENSAPVGTLRIFPQGLYTVFEARLPAKPPLPKGGCRRRKGSPRPPCHCEPVPQHWCGNPFPPVGAGALDGPPPLPSLPPLKGVLGVSPALAPVTDGFPRSGGPCALPFLSVPRRGGY